VLKGSDAWFDVTLWRSREDMAASAKIFNGRPSVQKLHRMVEVMGVESTSVAREYMKT
jgi:hypothetical protein